MRLIVALLSLSFLASVVTACAPKNAFSSPVPPTVPQAQERQPQGGGPWWPGKG